MEKYYFRNRLKHAYLNSRIWNFIFKIPKSVYDFYRYRILSDRLFIRQRFEYELGYVPDLDNPKTYNEKIQWLKLNIRDPLLTRCADKLAVRDFIREQIGGEYLIPLIFHTEDINDLRPEIFPDFPCIIKPNHSSMNYYVVRDKRDADWKKIRKIAKRWLRENYYYKLREWQYKNIPPCILVEKLLVGKDEKLPFDYKIQCFNGKVIFIAVHIDREDDQKINAYDTKWNPFEFNIGKGKTAPIPPPRNLEKMIYLAEKLSGHFISARIDFYEVGGALYFGEITFYSGSGFNNYEPAGMDRELGEKLILPINR